MNVLIKLVHIESLSPTAHDLGKHSRPNELPGTLNTNEDILTPSGIFCGPKMFFLDRDTGTFEN